MQSRSMEERMSDPRPNKAKESKDKPLRYKNPIASGKFRNDPCPCGSGKKIKKCHGVKDVLSKDELDSIITMVNNFNKRFQEALDNNLKDEMERLSRGDLSGEQEKAKDL